MTMRRWGIAPLAWGCDRNYDTMHLTPFAPVYWVVHHNGGGLPWIEDGADERAYLRQVVRWHADRFTNGFAYAGAIGTVTGKFYRGRHYNRSGAQWGEMNGICYAVLFTQGLGDGLPSLRARRTFGRLVLEHPMTVITHQKANQLGNDPGTSCPGDLIPWVMSKGWIEDFGVLDEQSPRSLRILSLRRRLVDLGYLRIVGLPGNRTRWTRALTVALRLFQENADLTVDGVLGPETYAALTNTTTSYAARHTDPDGMDEAP